MFILTAFLGQGFMASMFGLIAARNFGDAAIFAIYRITWGLSRPMIFQLTCLYVKPQYQLH